MLAGCHRQHNLTTQTLGLEWRKNHLGDPYRIAERTFRRPIVLDRMHQIADRRDVAVFVSPGFDRFLFADPCRSHRLPFLSRSARGPATILQDMGGGQVSAFDLEDPFGAKDLDRKAAGICRHGFA